MIPKAARPRSSAASTGRYAMQTHIQGGEVQQMAFQSGVQQAGWLWKRFGQGHKTEWHRLWFYLVDDRLCYCRAKAVADSGSNRQFPDDTAWVARAASNTACFAGALAAGEVRYIALDRIPVRPLPHRHHKQDPLRRSHPDVGVAIINSRVLNGQPANSPKRAVFSLVAGSHTHYLAAETAREAEMWISVIRESWLHCFSHTARSTGAMGAVVAAARGVDASQQLLAQNALLRESIQELNLKVSQSDGKYWKKWVEEKAKNHLLESQLINTASYEVLVKTGSDKGAGTDARVYLELFAAAFAASSVPARGVNSSPSADTAYPGIAAASGCGGEVRLFDADSGVKPFQRGALDSFTVLCHNIGVPCRLKVWHDNTGQQPDWFLEEIRVRKQGTKDWVYFECKRWLSTQHEDGRICRELLAGISRPNITYQIVVFTSDLRGAGTDANVHIQLHGLQGDGRRQQLLGSPTAFDRAQRDKFLVNDIELGQLTAVTIGHDGTGNSPAWHLDHVEVTPLGKLMQPVSRSSSPVRAGAHGTSSSTSSKKHEHLDATQLHGSANADGANPFFHDTREYRTYLFPCETWLDEQLGDGRTEKRLQAARTLPLRADYSLHSSTSSIGGVGTDTDVHVEQTGTEGSSGRVQLQSRPEHVKRPSETAEAPVELLGTTQDPRQQLKDYKVVTHTGDIRGAATDASVDVELLGTNGASSGLQQLPAQGPNSFQRGVVDAFMLKCKDLGELVGVRVGHDGAGAHPAWHLVQVEVSDVAAERTWYFEANCWLEPPAAGGRVEKLLTASPTNPLADRTVYQVTVHTSKPQDAGTDGRVFVTLCGSRGPPITSVPGSSSNSSSSDSSNSNSSPANSCLKTAGSSNAGTHGRGTALLYSSRCELHGGSGSNAAFEAGGSGTFVLPAMNGLGQLRRLVLELESIGVGPCSWHCHHLEVIDTKSGDRWLFPCNAWLHSTGSDSSKVGPNANRTQPGSAADADSCKLLSPSFCLDIASQQEQQGPQHQTLQPQCNQQQPQQQQPQQQQPQQQQQQCQSQPLQQYDAKGSGASATATCSYRITLTAGNMRGAGTDASVYIAIYGHQGATGRMPLSKPGRQCFERKQTDHFVVSGLDVGQMSHVMVGHDASGMATGWYLAELEVEHMPTGQVLRFKANRWLDSKRPGCATECELWPDQGHAAALQMQPPLQQQSGSGQWQVAWNLVVFTGSAADAGTNADAFIDLQGSSGHFGPYTLPAGPDAFEAGCRDSFTFSTPELGELQTVTIGHNNIGAAPAWFVERLELTNMQTGERYVVDCGAWLDDKSGCSRTLQVSAEQPLKHQRQQQQQPPWQQQQQHEQAAAAVAVGCSITTAELQTVNPAAHPPAPAASQEPVTMQPNIVAMTTKPQPQQQVTGAADGYVDVVAATASSKDFAMQYSHRAWLHSSIRSAGQPGYQVTFSTSNIVGAGTGAKVFFELIGEHGSSGMAYMISRQGQFMRGHQTTLLFPRLPFLGELHLLHVGSDGNSMPASWHLRQVEVVHLHSGQRWVFDCHGWIDKRCSWQRVLPAVSAVAVRAAPAVNSALMMS